MIQHHTQLMDVTGRDGAQDSVRLSAYAKIMHILKTHHWFDLIEPGWHSNPHDQVVLDFFANYPEINQKFVMLSPLHVPGKRDDEFDAFIHDARFGQATFLIKGLQEDALSVKGLASAQAVYDAIYETIQQQKEAMPDRPVGIAAEQGITGWRKNHEFLKACFQAAKDAGAEYYVLPDTDGNISMTQLN